jgi:hypothetical protein
VVKAELSNVVDRWDEDRRGSFVMCCWVKMDCPTDEDEVSEGKETQIEEIAGFRGDMRTPRKTKILPKQ